MKNSSLLKPILGVAITTALLLLIPLVAMQFTQEVAWGPGDFIVAAGLLFSAGALIVAGFTREKRTAYRIVIVVAVAVGMAVVWAELAVGLLA